MITPELLTELGVKLSNEEMAAEVLRLNTLLEERVGEEITSLLTDDQLERLAQLQDAGDDTSIAEYVKAFVPDMDDVVQDEYDILIGEYAEALSGKQ